MKKPKKRIPLPDTCRELIRYLAKSRQQAARAFCLTYDQACALFAEQPVMVSTEQLDLIQSVCANELNYALPARVTALMGNPYQAGNFVLWVNSAAAMLDMFRSIQAIQSQCSFVNPADPFLASLYHMAASMDEVEDFLEQLHRKCPQFDELFFRGTRFLDDSSQAAQPPVSRVPSSVDVLSLSPDDERIYEQFKE